MRQNLTNLLEKMNVVKSIYKHALNKIHGDAMKNDLRSLYENKVQIYNELNLLFNVKEDVSINIFKQAKLTIEKAQMEIDDILIRFNQHDILFHCLKVEKELIETYNTVLNDQEFSESEKEHIKSLKNDSVAIVERLDKTIADYKKTYQKS
mgnify:CR=1 FL=1